MSPTRDRLEREYDEAKRHRVNARDMGKHRLAEGSVYSIDDPIVPTARARWARAGLAPDGAPIPRAAAHVDSTLVKAIARAFRWRNMLEPAGTRP
jgi:hypothetical protein